MAKQLELIFENEEGRVVRLSLDSPIEPADPSVVSQIMDQILALNVFDSAGGELVSKRGARIIERNVEDIEIFEEEG